MLFRSQGRARQVVPLDVEIFAQLAAEVVQPVEGGGQLGQGDGGEVDEMFHGGPPCGCDGGFIIREKTEVGKRERDGVFRLIGHFGEIRLTGWNIYCMIYT